MVFLFFALFLLLFFPELTTAGARDGLLLWATILVPSLLPFSILTSTLTHFCKQGKQKYIVLLSGLLSGFPLGVIISGNFLAKQAISHKQAAFFSVATNLPSPMFIIYFVCKNQLNTHHTLSFVLLLYLSSFLGSSFFCKISSNHTVASNHAYVEQESFDLDSVINKSIQLLLKIGGYIVLFSILVTLINQLLPVPRQIKIILCLFLEITTGISNLCHSSLSANAKIILSLGACSLGGLSSAAQTCAYLPKAGLSFTTYLLGKLVNCCFALLFGALFLYFQLL